MKKQKENDKKQEEKNKNKWYYIIAIIVLLAVISITLILLFSDKFLNKDNKNNEIAYTELIKKIDSGEVEKVEMTVGSTSIKVKLKGDDEKDEKNVIIPSIQAFIELVQQKKLEGNNIELIQKKQNAFTLFILGLFDFLPTILLVILLVLSIKLQGIGDKGKVYDAETTKSKISFDDVAGLQEEKREMMEIVDFLKEPKRFNEMGAKIPRGVLLCGQPGTGKTLIAKAIAGEAKVPFISMSGSEFIEMFAGLGASRVRKLFEKQKKYHHVLYLLMKLTQ